MPLVLGVNESAVFFPVIRMIQRTEISGSDIRKVLFEAGVPTGGIYCLDSSYVMLSEEDVRGPLSESFTRFLDKNDIRYSPEEYDCEDFAGELWSFTKRSHAKQKKKTGCGVALGLMCNSQMAHGLNFAIHESDAGLLYVAAYEPQRDARGYASAPVDMRNLWPHSFLCVC